MTLKCFQFSKFSNNLEIRSEIQILNPAIQRKNSRRNYGLLGLCWFWIQGSGPVQCEVHVDRIFGPFIRVWSKVDGPKGWKWTIFLVDGRVKVDDRAKVDGLSKSGRSVEPKWTVQDDSGRSFEPKWTVMG